MYNESFNGTAARTVKSSPAYLSASKFTANDNEPKIMKGKDFEECKQKLFAAYGHNYTILWQRPQFQHGFFGFFQKEYYEVGYSIGSSSMNSAVTQSAQSSEPMSEQEKFKKERDEIIKSSSVTQTMQMASMDKKIEEMKKLMETTMKTMSEATKVGDKPLSILKIEEILQENEFTFAYINNITTRLRSELTVEELEDFNLVQEKVVDWIGESVSVAPEVMHKYPHVIILVGPTGVGKTTTIAKLAGTMIRDARKNDRADPKIRLITIDLTRVGALEQLRRYGDFLDAAVDQAESAEDVKKIYETYKDSIDVLFIDTPGYSPNDSENIGKMRKMLEVKGIHSDVYLTFMASSKARDMNSIIQNYEPFGYSSVIITKWDETSAIGNVISVLSEKGKTVSYITDGQQVPKTIERATVHKFLLNLNDININREHIDEKFAEVK